MFAAAGQLIGYFVVIILTIIAYIWGRYDAKSHTSNAPAAFAGGNDNGCKRVLQGTDVDQDEAAERKIAVPYARILDDSARELPYRSDTSRLRRQIHLGQRKLLLSEIEFLTLYGHLSNDVLYVGSAPGYHITMIVKLFPKHRFTLYDPRDFAVKAGPRVTIHQQFFTDEDAKKWIGRPHLLISDIRNADTYERGKSGEEDEHDSEVINDMNMQQSWINIAQPLMSILKFRLSWKLTHQDYLDGEIRFQPWAYKTSTETRLITDGKTTKTWDAKKYERQMYRFNTITRLAYYPIDESIVKRVRGMDYCYDCAAEVDIWTQYVKSQDGSADPATIADKVVKLINDTAKYTNNKGLDQDKHGLYRDIKDIHKRDVAICTDPRSKHKSKLPVDK